VTATRHLAHFNWATLRKPVGHPRVAPFVEAVPKVNALARRSPGYALWWIPVGHRPTLAEARAKVEALAAQGPSDAVFTFAELERAPDTP